MKNFSFTNVLILLAIGFFFLIAFNVFSADDQEMMWYKDVTTAVTVTLKWDTVAHSFNKIKVCNDIETTDKLFANKNGTAVPYTETTESKSVIILPTKCHEWDLLNKDSVISLACDTGQTCTGVRVYSSMRVQ